MMLGILHVLMTGVVEVLVLVVFVDLLLKLVPLFLQLINLLAILSFFLIKFFLLLMKVI